MESGRDRTARTLGVLVTLWVCACAQPSRVGGLLPDLAGAGVDLGGVDPGAVPDLGTADLPTVASVCGNGVCEAGERGASCGADCCDATTACAQTFGDGGLRFCRSMNGGAWAWYTQADTTRLCQDPSQIGKTTYACGGASGSCCSLPGGYVAGPCR